LAVEKRRFEKQQRNPLGGPNREHEHLELLMGAQQLESDDSASWAVRGDIRLLHDQEPQRDDVSERRHSVERVWPQPVHLDQKCRHIHQA